MRQRNDPALTFIAVLYVIVGVGLATAIIWPVYRTPQVGVVSAVGVTAGMLLAFIASRWRWSGWTVTTAAFALYLLIAVPVAIPYRLNPAGLLSGLIEAVAGVVVGWKQLLTLRLPVEDYQAVLAPWLAAVIAVTIIATSSGIRRDRASAWAVPALGGLALLAGLLGPVLPGEPLLLGPVHISDARTTLPGAALIVVTLLWLNWRGRILRSRALAAATKTTGESKRLRRTVGSVLAPVAAAATVAAVALGAGLAVTPWGVDHSQRTTLREHVEPVLAIQSQPSPLDQYRSFFTSEAVDSELFRVSVSGAPVERLRIAVLDEYDGQHFSTATKNTSGLFVRMPRSSAVDATSLVNVTIGSGLAGIWVPVPTGLSAAPTFSGTRADQLAAGFYVSDDSGSAIEVADTGVSAPGLRAGDHYVVPTVGSEPGVLGPPGEISLPTQSYPALIAWVKAQGEPRTAAGFTNLVADLRARGYLSHWLDAADATAWLDSQNTQVDVVPAYAGHSTARIEDLFIALNNQQKAVGTPASDAALVAAIGDDEQFATAVALLARYFGYESRIVLGVRLVNPGVSSLASCTDGVCTGADLSAWVEIRSDAGDWVTVDSSPQTANPPRPVTQGQEPPMNATQVQQPDPQPVEPPKTVQDSDNSHDDQLAGDEQAQWWWAVARITAAGMGSVIFLLLPLTVVPVVKAVRRRKRRGAHIPEVAAVGAWEELADRCLDLGVPLTGATRAEAAATCGRPAAAALAQLVDYAVFSPNPPGAQIRDDAWDLVHTDLQEVRSDVSAWGRVVAAVRPTSLLHAATKFYGASEPAKKELS